MNALRIASLLICMLASFSVYSQDRKAERQERREERRELRRLERAVRDSLRLRQMEEESINIGYGTISKKNLTTSVSQVKVRQEDVSSYANIGEYLSGRVPGLIVQKVGSTYKYSVRGINSINSSTDPLFVVDGAVVMDIDSINPRDIKSVEVLKDASASIYGTRGACGVILITTRRSRD
ncbi:MAG: TonB-dependent receptor plug domain-containing protein [Bacteroidales bacterium]|nr:TonB-dependent receptor plug domain-containing protein [Bacteroidales bacterium]